MMSPLIEGSKMASCGAKCENGLRGGPLVIGWRRLAHTSPPAACLGAEAAHQYAHDIACSNQAGSNQKMAEISQANIFGWR